MFEAINKHNNRGYVITHSLPKSIQEHTSTITYSQEFKLSGYIDDTTWFSNDIPNLEESLSIADDFYQLANICINKDKTILITNNPDLQDKKISILFGNEPIEVQSVSKFSNERILGIYINADCNKKYTINKITKCINYTLFLLRKKKISHDMCTYVINRVIIPRIEYWSQHIAIPETTCKKWDIKIRSLYKQFLNLPRSTVNEIFSSHFYLNTPNIYDVLIRNWTAQLIAKTNTPLCQNISRLNIINNQIKFHSPSAFPEFLQFYKGSTKHFSLTDFLCIHLPRLNLKMDMTNFHVIKGGHTPIMNFLINCPNFKSTVKSLRNRNIMFIDQIITPDGLFLRSWKDLQKDETVNCSKGRTPKWYKYILDNFTNYTNSNQNYRLTFTINSPIISTSFAQRFPPPPLGTISRDHRNKLIAFWNNSKKEIEYAKVIHSSNRINNTPTLYTEHYNIIYSQSNSSSPGSTKHELIKCN